MLWEAQNDEACSGEGWLSHDAKRSSLWKSWSVREETAVLEDGEADGEG